MDLAQYIDHTLLKPGAMEGDIIALCREASGLRCFSVCVNGCWVPVAQEALRGTGVKVCSVVGFPLGAMGTEAKVSEAESYLALGADEIDMVLNIGWLKQGSTSAMRDDIAAVQERVAANGKLLKVIIETALLDQNEKQLACELICETGAAFVKTCTGFAGGLATVEDISLIRSVVKDRARIKASGGIRDRAAAEALIVAGADRLGTSSARAILTGGESKSSY